MEDLNWMNDIECNFEDIFSETPNTGSGPYANNTIEEHEQNPGDYLFQGMENGVEEFTGPMSNTENVGPAFPSLNMDAQSHYLEIPPGINPATLLDTMPDVHSNSIAQPTSGTDSFSHVPNGNIQSTFASSSTFVPPHNLSNEDFFLNMFASSFDVSNEVAPTNLHLPSYLSNQANGSEPSNYNAQNQYLDPSMVQPEFQSLEHFTYNTINQHLDLSQMDGLGDNFSNQNTYYNVGANLEQQQQQQHFENDQRENVGRVSFEDGYIWISNGKKLVNGKGYTREYFECCYPECHVSKRVERTIDGHLFEIINKGYHNHTRFQPLSGQNFGLQSSFAGNNFLPQTGRHDGAGPSNYTGGDPVSQHNNNPGLVYGNRDMPFYVQNGSQLNFGDTMVGSVSLNPNGHGDTESRKRKSDGSSTGKATKGERVVVQTSSDVDILDDGYRWRKYGQKLVKGNPNPRSYYKCTGATCCVRKHIERSGVEKDVVVTTYDGRHNHEVPPPRFSRHDYISVYNDYVNQTNNARQTQLGGNASTYEVGSSSSQVPQLGSYYQGPRLFGNNQNLGMSDQGIGNQGHGGQQLPPVFPIHQFLRQQRQPNLGRSPPLPQLEQQGMMNLPGTSSYYHQDMNTNTPGPGGPGGPGGFGGSGGHGGPGGPGPYM